MQPANRLGLDYAKEAQNFGAPPRPIIDVHTHVNGARAARLFRDAMQQYGIGTVFSMTQFEDIGAVREVLGDTVHFIAIPRWTGDDPLHEHALGFIPWIERFAKLGVTIAKFWSAPRIYRYGSGVMRDHPLRLDAPGRLAAMNVAVEHGMKLMVHIGDPDTWFATTYRDEATYGSKLAQYEQLERVLDRFDVPLIAAHMGGYPEDLHFLSTLLERHPNLYLDTSATKWMVRELSRHSHEELLAFCTRWRGRLLFGSDIVTSDAHLSAEGASEMAQKAASEREAYDLYASRYWALRTLWERTYEGPSPIADPDLAMVDPERYGPLDAPTLRGQHLPEEVLEDLYHDAAQRLLLASPTAERR